MKLISILTFLGFGTALGMFFHAHLGWTFWLLAKFLMAFIAAFFFGLITNAAILFPLLYNLPRSIYLYFTGSLRFAGIYWQLIPPILWLLGFTIFGLIDGYMGASAVAFLSGNRGVNLGLWLATVAVLLFLVTPSGRKSLKADYEKNTFARFGKNQHTEGVAVRDDFDTAIAAYDIAHDAIHSYTTRANHRFEISIARHDETLDAEAHDEIIAAYTDPADFAPYTEAELDAHTAAMENLTAAFDTLTAAFATFNPADDNIASTAAELYKVYCETHKFAADAYSRAALCAIGTALEGEREAIEKSFHVACLEARASGPDETNPVAAKAKADAFRTKTDNDANMAKAKALEKKARIAETKAKEFLAKVEAFSTKYSAA